MARVAASGAAETEAEEGGAPAPLHTPGASAAPVCGSSTAGGEELTSSRACSSAGASGGYMLAKLSKMTEYNYLYMKNTIHLSKLKTAEAAHVAGGAEHRRRPPPLKK